MAKKNIKKDADSKLPRSYCLFGPNSNVNLAPDKDNGGQKTPQATPVVRKEKPVRSQDTVKKPVIPEQGTENAGNDATEAKPANKKRRTDNNTKSVSVTGKGKCSKGAEPGDNKAEVTERSEQGNNNKPEADVRKTDTGVKGRKRKEEISVFPKSNTPLGNIKLNSIPTPTDDFSIVRVEMDGKTYEVSSWSIREGQYIQGLDSNFLVHNFVTKKK